MNVSRLPHDSHNHGGMKMETPNLDGMFPDDLRAFAMECTQGIRPIRAARKYFGTSAKGRTRAIRDLGHYAWNKLTAMECRIRGDIPAALNYEAICDRIYGRLPNFARW